MLHLVPTTADRIVLDAVEFLKANRQRSGEYIPDHVGGESVSLSFASEAWGKILRDRRRPSRLMRRHFEACVLSYLAAELRADDIAVVGSGSFANLHERLLSWQQCQPLLAEYCAEVGLPAGASGFRAELEQRLTEVAAAASNAGLRRWRWRKPCCPGFPSGPVGCADPHRVLDRVAPPLRPGVRFRSEDQRHDRQVRPARLHLRGELGPLPDVAEGGGSQQRGSVRGQQWSLSGSSSQTYCLPGTFSAETPSRDASGWPSASNAATACSMVSHRR